MQYKVIEVIAPRGYTDTVVAIAEENKAADWQVYDLRPAPGAADDDGDDAGDKDGAVCVRILTAQMQRQILVDRIHSVLTTCEAWRLTILPVDGVLPAFKPDDEQVKAERAESLTTTREELYSSVAGAADLTVVYMVLVLLSTMVAGIGLVSDNIAVVIGAMVIAPLLGPNLALALGTALGDRGLMGKAFATGAAGIALAIAVSAAVSFTMSLPLDSHELMLRTEVGYDAIALALASGAAAALSLTTGLSTTLVGVMVAVALLPPSVTAGLMAGAARLDLAFGALTLLTINVISVLLAAQVVFLVKGVRPHRWLERKAAQQSSTLMIVISVVLLIAAALIIANEYALAGG